MQGGLDYEIISLVDVDNENHPLQGIRSVLETIDDSSLGVGVVPFLDESESNPIPCARYSNV